MIPPFNDDGYLPPGIYPATLDEIAERFGKESELRQVQMDSLRWLIELARRAAVQRIVVDGSFVTDKLEPNDVDCVLLIGPGFPADEAAEADLLAGLPFMTIELVGLEAFQQLTERTFATDRNMVPKWKVDGGDCPMSIENRRQLENTRAKLLELEQLYQQTEQGPSTDDHVRDLTLRSLKQRINRFKEEIARFEARVASGEPKN